VSDATEHTGREQHDNILVWLPSPMGDAILSIPALRAIRRCFKTATISFLASPTVREVLSPTDLADDWIERTSANPFTTARILRRRRFTQAILLKNSFDSALAAFLAGIPTRIGYARDGRAALLTDKLYPPKLPCGRFKPISMIDYYLALAHWLGAEASDRTIQLQVKAKDKQALHRKLSSLADRTGPLVVLVPGGSFGPSKCWPARYFAQLADRLIAEHHATVVISVAPTSHEIQIARSIQAAAHHKLIDSSRLGLTLGQLKALLADAELVVTNDTGPRHIAIALGRKLITLFGPNDPAWTQTDHPGEIQIVANLPCAPCARPICKQNKHKNLCMHAIPVETVYEAAVELLQQKEPTRTKRYILPRFEQLSRSFFANSAYLPALRRAGLTSIQALAQTDAATMLTKPNLSRFRTRARLQLPAPAGTVFLKLYHSPPLLSQLRNWLTWRCRQSHGEHEYQTALQLAAAGINTPTIVAYGTEWGRIFEKTSFVLTAEIPSAEALERQLPACFRSVPTPPKLRDRRQFIAELAHFIRTFHDTGFCHRDLYLAHVFYDDLGRFHLIDLARAFKPVRRRRFQIKDIAQLHYSAPAQFVTITDRLRFYRNYRGCDKLTREDKIFIRRVITRALRMARHDRKHGRPIPFLNRPSVETRTYYQ